VADAVDARVKIIAVGATRAMLQASCPAPETMSRCE
jgi:hypothetical protein